MKTKRLATYRRCGFTLVELLVVIVIIGMLVALLVPAVNAARESARQAQCMNNQKELSTAVQEYTVAKGRYPGFENAYRHSWIVALLPGIGRNDLAQPMRSTTNPNPGVEVGQFICPDVRTTANQQLSYVVNHRIFRNRFSNTNENTISPEDVPNQQITPMISETVDSFVVGTITVRQWTPFASADGNVLTQWIQDAQQVTFDWPIAGNRLMDLDTTSEVVAARFQIDAGEDLGIRAPAPSSNHPGIVIVTFCDGHADKIRVDRPLEANVYNPGPVYPTAPSSGSLSYGY